MINIILPTKSRCHLLKNAVESILSQSSEDWRLWIGTDGVQEDDTIDYISSLLSDRRIYHINIASPIGGHLTVEALLDCLEAPEYVICMSDDDLLYPGAVEGHTRAIKAHKNVDATVGNWTLEYVDSDGSVAKRSNISLYNRMTFVNKEADLVACHTWNPYVLSACCYRVDTLQRLAFLECVYPKARYIQWDWLATAGLLIEDFNVIGTNYLTGKYVIRNDISQASSVMPWGKHFIKMFEYMKKADMPEHLEQMFEKVVTRHIKRDVDRIINKVEPGNYTESMGEILGLLELYTKTKGAYYGG